MDTYLHTLASRLTRVIDDGDYAQVERIAASIAREAAERLADIRDAIDADVEREA